MEGDQVSSKGSLTGGYFNQLRSRLDIQKTRSELSGQITELENELSELKESIKTIDCSISSLVTDMQRTETKNSKAK